MCKGENMLYYTIFMPWLARELQKRGFKLEKMVENTKRKGFMVYQFKDSVELQNTIYEILNSRKN